MHGVGGHCAVDVFVGCLYCVPRVVVVMGRRRGLLARYLRVSRRRTDEAMRPRTTTERVADEDVARTERDRHLLLLPIFDLYTHASDVKPE